MMVEESLEILFDHLETRVSYFSLEVSWIVLDYYVIQRIKKGNFLHVKLVHTSL